MGPTYIGKRSIALSMTVHCVSRCDHSPVLDMEGVTLLSLAQFCPKINNMVFRKVIIKKNY